MKIKINEKEVELRYSFRSLINYEQIKGKSFSPSTISDMITFFYCCVTASDKTLQLTEDEFIDWLDENPYAVEEFGDWLTATVSLNNGLYPVKEGKGKNKKK